MLQLLLDLICTVGEEQCNGLFRPHTGKTAYELPKGAHRIRLGISRRVVVYELQDQIEERLGQLKTENVQSALDRLQDRFLHLTTRRILFTPLFREVLE